MAPQPGSTAAMGTGEMASTAVDTETTDGQLGNETADLVLHHRTGQETGTTQTTEGTEFPVEDHQEVLRQMLTLIYPHTGAAREQADGGMNDHLMSDHGMTADDTMARTSDEIDAQGVGVGRRLMSGERSETCTEGSADDVFLDAFFYDHPERLW